MPDPASKFENWLEKGDEDRAAIRLLLAGPGTPWAVVCFHAQQAAEKHLKALLVERGQRVERTHELSRLLAQLLPLEPALAGLHDDCVAISDYGVDARYPDILLGDLEALGREAVASCDRICAAVRKHLPIPPLPTPRPPDQPSA
jgi:HEPN domain-containing protein